LLFAISDDFQNFCEPQQLGLVIDRQLGQIHRVLPFIPRRSYSPRESTYVVAILFAFATMFLIRGHNSPLTAFRIVFRKLTEQVEGTALRASGYICRKWRTACCPILLVATECCHRCKVMLPPCGVTSGKVMLPPSAIQTCHMKRSGLSWHLSPAQQPFEAPRARLRRG
jgi:hypothetical protein